MNSNFAKDNGIKKQDKIASWVKIYSSIQQKEQEQDEQQFRKRRTTATVEIKEQERNEKMKHIQGDINRSSMALIKFCGKQQPCQTNKSLVRRTTALLEEQQSYQTDNKYGRMKARSR